MVRSRGLTHIQLAVRDIERSVRFYKTVFGLVTKFEAGPGMAFLTTPGAHDIITLNANGSPDRAGDGGGMAHFGFHVEDRPDFEKALELAVSAGGRLIKRGLRETADCPEEPWAFVADPDGYVVEIYSPTVVPISAGRS